MPPTVFSCLVDDHPKFRLQSLNVIGSLLATATVRNATAIHVHLVNDHPGAYRDALAKIGVTVVAAAPYGAPASPYCNKLVQLTSRPVRKAGQLVLLDTDVVVTTDLSGPFARPGLRAKTVDTAIPPLPLLTALVRRAGFRDPVPTVPTDFGHGDTSRGNCNGGVYCGDGKSFARLAPYWIKWAGWTLCQEKLLGPSVKHADQIGFLLALLETGLALTPLPLALNFPTHLKKTTYAPAHDRTPALIHYHDRLDDAGLLVPLGLPLVDAAIAAVNARLSAFHDAFVPPALLHAFRDARRP